jgi:acetyl esterase
MAFALGPRARAQNYRVQAFDSIGSTNAEALERARAGERGPLWLVTDLQTAGRGRRQREWVSPRGNLAATSALACRDAGIRLAGQLLVYPVTDVVGNFADAAENARFPSRAENAEGYFLSRAVMEWFCGHYLEERAQGADWRVSPLRAKELKGVAPAVVTTAWFDPLRDEGVAYADALREAGVPTRHHDGQGLIHGYFGLGDASEVARAEAQRARADFKALLDKGA